MSCSVCQTSLSLDVYSAGVKTMWQSQNCICPQTVAINCIIAITPSHLYAPPSICCRRIWSIKHNNVAISIAAQKTTCAGHLPLVISSGTWWITFSAVRPVTYVLYVCFANRSQSIHYSRRNGLGRFYQRMDCTAQIKWNWHVQMWLLKLVEEEVSHVEFNEILIVSGPRGDCVG